MKTLIAIAIAALTQINGNQPYSITTHSKITPALMDMCRNDENCMDIEQLDVEMHDRLVKSDCYTHIDSGKRKWIIITPTATCLEIAYPSNAK